MLAENKIAGEKKISRLVIRVVKGHPLPFIPGPRSGGKFVVSRAGEA